MKWFVILAVLSAVYEASKFLRRDGYRTGSWALDLICAGSLLGYSVWGCLLLSQVSR